MFERFGKFIDFFVKFVMYFYILFGREKIRILQKKNRVRNNIKRTQKFSKKL